MRTPAEADFDTHDTTKTCLFLNCKPFEKVSNQLASHVAIEGTSRLAVGVDGFAQRAAGRRQRRGRDRLVGAAGALMRVRGEWSPRRGAARQNGGPAGAGAREAAGPPAPAPPSQSPCLPPLNKHFIPALQREPHRG